MSNFCICSIITAFKLEHRLSGVYKVCGCIGMGKGTPDLFGHRWKNYGAETELNHANAPTYLVNT